MTEIEELKARYAMIEHERNMYKGQLDNLRSRCYGDDALEAFDRHMFGRLKISAIETKDVKVDKEKPELLNLLNRIEAQRVEIKCLQERLDRQKEYTKLLEDLIADVFGANEVAKERYNILKNMA